MVLSTEYDYRDYSEASFNAASLLERGIWPSIPGQIILDDVLSALPWPAAILDQDGVVVSVNYAWLHLAINEDGPTLPRNGIGLSYVDLLRQGFGLSDGRAREACQGVHEVLAGRQARFTLEFFYHMLAQQRWSQLAVTSLANGRPGALIQRFDITERKLAEHERDEAIQEREKAMNRDAASREASRQMELFMAMAGHEVRTPLTVIKAYIQLAMKQLKPALPPSKLGTTWVSAQSSLCTAQQAASRLTILLDDLLQVTNAKAGRLEMHPESCDLIALVRERLAEYRQMYPSRRLHLNLARQRHVLIQADPVRVTEVLTNFLNNAYTYSPESMPIEVKLHLDEGVVRLSVRDRGPGLSRSAQGSVWDCFFKVPDVKPRIGGEANLGLGLYIARAIVEQHGGNVGVESKVGKGAIFWCTFPLSAAES